MIFENRAVAQVALESKYDRSQIHKLIKNKLSMVEDKLLQQILGLLITKSKRISISALVAMLYEKEGVKENPNIIIEKLLPLIPKIVEVSTDDKKRLYFKSNISLTDEEQEIVNNFQYKLPMIIQPLEVNHKGNNRGDGYYLNSNKSLILNQEHQLPISNDSLNSLNKIPFCINQDLKVFEPRWSDDKLEDVLKEEMKKENFKKFKKAIANASAVMINHGNKFWFTHKFDFRGRIYCCGYQLHYQGISFQKAQLEFFNKEEISIETKFF